MNKQTCILHIENAKNHGVQKQKRPIKKQNRPIKKQQGPIKMQKRPVKMQKRPVKMPTENAKTRRVPSSWCFVGGLV